MKKCEIFSRNAYKFRQINKKEMESQGKVFRHLCYNNIIILEICQLKRNLKNYGKDEKRKLFFQKQSKEKRNRLISFICFFVFL